ncbi:hypothetical protein [Burkholderia ubonensis]|uniref:hypothetical protein n=1 Tax=Burkholderia ubonensis TaxID=101571 RepID=UPI0011612462|nr:hypothetical protein [Burkholderia ubonensis]
MSTINKTRVVARGAGMSGALAERQEQLEREFVETRFRIGRKTNTAADPKNFKRYALMAEEAKKRGVRFLPAQVMRPIFQAAGL